MLTLVRHAVSILALPVVVAIVVPWWIARRNDVALSMAGDLAGLALQLVGAALLAMGLWLFVYSLTHFARRGKGTLAPWDPPKTLVVSGPYRYVRNPMISGVVFVLLGESLILRSMPHLTWALAFLAINAVYIPLFEEPMLELRFGDAYRRYRSHVGRLIPRLRPWPPDDGHS